MKVSLPIWFDTDATIRVPTGKHSSEALLLNIINPADEEKPLQIDVNGEILFADTIPPGNWCQFFPLPTKSTEDVFIRLSRPSRELLLLRGITLLDHVPGVFHGTYSTDPLTPSGYRSRLTLISPHYPKTLMRGTMGTLRLSVTNAGDRPWPTPCEIGNAPGAVQLGILWFPMHAADRDLASRVAEGRAALPYALAPGDALSLTAILAPFTQAGDPLPPGEYEVWIGPVQESITWFFHHGDNVLKFPVVVIR